MTDPVCDQKFYNIWPAALAVVNGCGDGNSVEGVTVALCNCDVHYPFWVRQLERFIIVNLPFVALTFFMASAL